MIDCSVNILNPDLWYSAGVCVLGNRTIHADIATQMPCRCRRCALNEVVYILTPPVLDFDLAPGFYHERAAEPLASDAEPLSFTTLAAAKRVLHRDKSIYNEDRYYVKTRRGIFLFRRRKPPHHVTYLEARERLLAPARINHAVAGLAEAAVVDLAALLDGASDIAAAEMLPGHAGLARFLGNGLAAGHLALGANLMLPHSRSRARGQRL